MGTSDVLKIKKTTAKTESHFKFRKCKPLSNIRGLLSPKCGTVGCGLQITNLVILTQYEESLFLEKCHIGGVIKSTNGHSHNCWYQRISHVFHEDWQSTTPLDKSSKPKQLYFRAINTSPEVGIVSEGLTAFKTLFCLKMLSVFIPTPRLIQSCFYSLIN